MRTIGEISSRWLRRKPESLSEAENRVLQSAIDNLAIAENLNVSEERRASIGDQVADILARVGGSWAFLISFIAFLIVWTIANAWLLGRDTFDPYPFVFLNLVLSMVAALQAPIIMMSQNRQASRDRRDAEHDYQVNLKAEIEILALHDKLDALRHNEIVALREQVADLTRTVERLANRRAAK